MWSGSGGRKGSLWMPTQQGGQWAGHCAKLPPEPSKWISLPVGPIGFFFQTTTLIYSMAKDRRRSVEAPLRGAWVVGWEANFCLAEIPGNWCQVNGRICPRGNRHFLREVQCHSRARPRL
jgi:hypothetical protein